MGSAASAATTGGSTAGGSATTGETEPCGSPVAGMVCVPAGPFLRGDQDAVDGDAWPAREITLSAFWIDETEVSYGQYLSCVDAGACPPIEPGNVGPCGPEPPLSAEHPATCLTWVAAGTYCDWVGKRLPTEAEWEKAARGTDGRTYPWGEEAPTCDHTVMVDGCGMGTSWPVGTHPGDVSPYGARDMAGNVKEWVADWYDPNYYEVAPDEDPPGPEVTMPGAEDERVVRGSFYLLLDTSNSFKTWERVSARPLVGSPFLGFRCARDGEP